uniref:C-type lectin domain-containing protein n=1 Tax=Sander lucioperca TaxID=283035 RepID=A0A8C9Z2Y5_SANLU
EIKFLIYVFASDSHCDPGYLLYEDFCYHFESESVKNWQDAETHCSREQGHLASFHSEEQLSFLIGEKAFYVSARPGDVWTGLNDLVVTGMFTWSDDHMVTFTYWAPGEPNNHDGFSEDCVEMLHQVRRIEITVSYTYTFILQIQSQNLTKVYLYSFLFLFFAVNCGHFDVNLLFSRLDDGTTCPVQNSIPTYVKCPKHITQCPL